MGLVPIIIQRNTWDHVLESSGLPLVPINPIAYGIFFSWVLRKVEPKMGQRKRGLLKGKVLREEAKVETHKSSG